MTKVFPIAAINTALNKMITGGKVIKKKIILLFNIE